MICDTLQDVRQEWCKPGDIPFGQFDGLVTLESPDAGTLLLVQVSVVVDGPRAGQLRRRVIRESELHSLTKKDCKGL